MNADADEAYLEHQASCRPGAAFRVRPEMDLDIAPLCKCHRAEWATVGPFSRVCADVTDQVRAVGKAGGARFTAVWPLSSVDPFMEHEAAAMLRRVATETALISLCQPCNVPRQQENQTPAMHQVAMASQIQGRLVCKTINVKGGDQMQH